jgi:hypothetical protein
MQKRFVIIDKPFFVLDTTIIYAVYRQTIKLSSFVTLLYRQSN